MATRFQWVQLLVSNSKVIVGAYILLAGAGFAGGYYTSNVAPEPKVVALEQPAPVVAESGCNENLIARVCGSVVRGHEGGRLH